MRRAAGLAIAVVAAMTLAAAASAAPDRFAFSKTIDAVRHFGGCCANITRGETTTGIPRLGRATLTVDFFVCGASYCPPGGQASVFIVIVTRSGDRLQLETVVTSISRLGTAETASGTWTVFSNTSTGKFASAIGSGTFTVTSTTTGPGGPGGAPAVLTISLDGTLSLE